MLTLRRAGFFVSLGEFSRRILIVAMNQNLPTHSHPHQDPARPDLLWPIALAMALDPANEIRSLQMRGILGSLLLTSSALPLYADLETLVLPGLTSLGIGAEIAPMPENIGSLRILLRGSVLPVFEFNGDPVGNEDEEDATDETAELATIGRMVEIDCGRTLSRCGVVVEVGDEHVLWRNRLGAVQSDSYAAFRSAFSCALDIRSPVRRRIRRAGLMEAINRAVLYGLAYPDRLVTGSDADSSLRHEAAQFLANAAGSLRDPVSRRWRIAANCLLDGKVADAVDWLYEAMLRCLGLPEAVHRSLARSADTPLTGLERRELIYLARAGNRYLKVLSTHRLSREIHSPGVRHTLEQLALSPDPLVRASATNRDDVMM